LADSDFVMDATQPLDPRKTIFVGGVPRPLRAGRSALFIIDLQCQCQCQSSMKARLAEIVIVDVVDKMRVVKLI